MEVVDEAEHVDVVRSKGAQQETPVADDIERPDLKPNKEELAATEPQREDGKNSISFNKPVVKLSLDGDAPGKKVEQPNENYAAQIDDDMP